MYLDATGCGNVIRLIGVGTNNARIAGMLRNLSSYYYKDANLLFCVMLLLNSLYFSVQYFMEFIFFIFLYIYYENDEVPLPLLQVRIAQGLVNMGKRHLLLVLE